MTQLSRRYNYLVCKTNNLQRISAQETNHKRDRALTKELAEHFLADENSVDLNVFPVIEDAAAESLSKYKGDRLFHLDLKGVPRSAAAILRKNLGKRLAFIQQD